MREFRKKQKKLKTIMNIMIAVTAIYMLVYIGTEPFIVKEFGINVNQICNLSCDVLVVVTLAVLFVYTSRYGKSDKFLEGVENELSDTGYYYTSRMERDVESYTKTVVDDLRSNGYKVDEKVEADELEFTAVASKGKEFFYILAENDIDKNDVIAYLQSGMYDLTNSKLKRKANCVMLYICDKADDGAISLSKMITPLGKKEQIKFANAIVEISTGRCYFLGNKPTKCQQMIANYAMNCQVPIKEEYIGKENLPFQQELEEHMKSFNVKDYKNGTFFSH
ncbi:MAG: hypothetical protein ACI4IN_03695 [Eubacterium sp.]